MLFLAASYKEQVTSALVACDSLLVVFYLPKRNAPTRTRVELQTFICVSELFAEKATNLGF
jgi:hypothetical protein